MKIHHLAHFHNMNGEYQHLKQPQEGTSNFGLFAVYVLCRCHLRLGFKFLYSQFGFQGILTKTIYNTPHFFIKYKPELSLHGRIKQT